MKRISRSAHNREIVGSTPIPATMKTLIASYTRKDFRVDSFNSGGPGGQHQNKTKSGCRITHIASGLVAECRETKSWHQNRTIAFRRLAVLIKHWHIEQLDSLPERSREVIRTYNVPDNRVKDHLTGQQSSCEEVFADISEMVEARRNYDQK